MPSWLEEHFLQLETQRSQGWYSRAEHLQSQLVSMEGGDPLVRGMNHRETGPRVREGGCCDPSLLQQVPWTMGTGALSSRKDGPPDVAGAWGC